MRTFMGEGWVVIQAGELADAVRVLARVKDRGNAERSAECGSVTVA